MPEQFDLFKKPTPEPSETELPRPSKEDEEFAIGEFEESGKPVRLIEPRKEKRGRDSAFDNFKKDMKKLFGEKGAQSDLPIDGQK